MFGAGTDTGFCSVGQPHLCSRLVCLDLLLPKQHPCFTHVVQVCSFRTLEYACTAHPCTYICMHIYLPTYLPAYYRTAQATINVSQRLC